MYRIVSLFILQIYCVFTLTAQSRMDRHLMHQKYIDSLKQSELLVILPGYNRQIQALDSLFQQSKANTLIDQKNEIVQRRDQTANDWKSAFASVFTFTNYTFLWDHDVKTIDKTYPFWLHVGDLESGAKALILTKQNFVPMPDRFPFYQKLKPFWAWMSKKSSAQIASETVAQLQAKWNRF